MTEAQRSLLHFCPSTQSERASEHRAGRQAGNPPFARGVSLPQIYERRGDGEWSEGAEGRKGGRGEGEAVSECTSENVPRQVRRQVRYVVQ